MTQKGNNGWMSSVPSVNDQLVVKHPEMVITRNIRQAGETKKFTQGVSSLPDSISI